MILLLKMNRTEYGSTLQGYPTAPQYAIGRSDVICLLTRMNESVHQVRMEDPQIFMEYCSSERMSDDVFVT